MRSLRVFAAIAAFVLSLVVPSVACARTPADSVYPLQIIQVTASLDGFGPASAELATICTVTSINESKRYWLTAAHCVADPQTRYIMGDVATVVIYSPAHDVAILQTTRASAPAVPLAASAPRVKDYIEVTGYPFGFPFQVTTVGTIAALEAELEPGTPPFTLFNITGAPGNSGSAVLNGAGEIVSIVQIGWGRSFSPMMGGVPFEVLAQIRAYWE